MAFGAKELPARNIDDFRKVLNDQELKLANAKKQRETIILDMRKAGEASKMGDQPALRQLNNLYKAEAAAGRLVLSITDDIAVAKKRVEMAQGQIDAMRARADVVEAQRSTAPHNKVFEVAKPDGSVGRHRHASADALQKALLPGYKVVAEVLGAGIDGKGGLAEPLGQSTMKTLLAVHGDELIAFLAERGIVGNDKTVVILPQNNRELQ